MVNYQHPDLTQHPPRSGRVRLGGFAHLPRLLDKARAFLAGKNAEYHYNCPLDQRFFAFTGINPDAMLAEIKTGKCDFDMLEWVLARCSPARGPQEIAQWSAWLDAFGPGGAEGHEWVVEVITTNAPRRSDIRSFFGILDLDDYVSYGGKS